MLGTIKNCFLFFVSLYVAVLPFISNAAWTDNLIFYAPLNDPNNPLTVSVGTGEFSFSRITPATYIHPITNFVTLSASNIIPNSEDFSAWSATSSQVIVDQVIAPDGTMTADQFIVGPASDGSRTHYVEMAATSSSKIPASQVFNSAVFVKPNTNTWVGVTLVGKSGTANTCYFNAVTGAVGTCSANTAGTSTVEANGFYRFSVSASLSTGASIVRTRVYLANGDNVSTWTGDGSKSVYLWGGHMNFGPILSTYLRTTNDSSAQARIESEGYLSESTRTNYLLWSRDFTKSAWIKSGVVANQTAVGHDGIENSASVVEATTPDGTVCQSITLSATSSGSVDIKRISGSGSVSISMNGGSTYGQDVSGSLSNTSWYRALYENQRITNPTFCIKLGTSGDSVALDYAQIETSATPSAPLSAPFASSRIPTTSTTNTRFIDRLSIPSSGNWVTTEGSFFAIADTWDTANANKFLMDVSPLVRVPIHIRSALGNGANGILGRTTIYDGSGECSFGSVNVQPQISTKMVSRWSVTSGIRSTAASGSAPANCAFDGAMESGGTFTIGDTTSQDGSRTLWGHIKQLRVYSTSFSDEDMQLSTAGPTSDIGDVPSTPRSLATSSITTSSVTLDWIEPLSDGGSAITDYYIQYSSGGASTTWSHVPSTATTSVITSLSPNTTYTFTVSAVNAVGTSSVAIAYATTSVFNDEDIIQATSTSSVVQNSETIIRTQSGGSVSSRYTNLMMMGDIKSAVELARQYPYYFGLNDQFPIEMKTNIFYRDLTVGAVGDDVKQLQIFLNSKGYFISKTGPGSVGKETNFFGKLTRNALAKFQTSNHIRPSIGYFGPKTRSYLSR